MYVAMGQGQIIHVDSPMEGANHPCGTVLMSNETLCHYDQMVQV